MPPAEVLTAVKLHRDLRWRRGIPVMGLPLDAQLQPHPSRTVPAPTHLRSLKTRLSVPLSSLKASAAMSPAGNSPTSATAARCVLP